MKGHGDDSAKWAEWEAEPKPYGGFQALSKIRRAKERNITELNLSKNKITDVTPLPWLTNLTTLNLLDNQISDLSPLAGLTKLQELRLSKNPITDFAPLAKLTNLTELSLKEIQITDDQKNMLRKALPKCEISF